MDAPLIRPLLGPAGGIAHRVRRGLGYDACWGVGRVAAQNRFVKGNQGSSRLPDGDVPVQRAPGVVLPWIMHPGGWRRALRQAGAPRHDRADPGRHRPPAGQSVAARRRRSPAGTGAARSHVPHKLCDRHQEDWKEHQQQARQPPALSRARLHIGESERSPRRLRPPITRHGDLPRCPTVPDLPPPLRRAERSPPPQPPGQAG